MKRLLCIILTAAMLLCGTSFAAADGFGGLLNNVQQNFQPYDAEKIDMEQLDAQELLEEAAAGKKLTIMVYMCGSNLESAPQSSATRDIQEMIASGFSTKDINLVLMPGGAKKWHISNINGEQTGIYSVRPEGITELWNSGTSLNMGEPETLNTLLDFGFEKFPAEKYALVIWNHGGGSIGGVCHDENADDMLSIPELISALEKSPFAEKKLEWLGFDACLMASAEVSIMVAPYARYMVASEDTEPGYGWDYRFLKGIDEDDSGAETGNRIVKAYIDFYKEKMPQNEVTLSCINLTESTQLADKIDGFFKTAAGIISEENSADISKAVRKVKSFGNSTGNMRTSAFDLLDLGELVQSLDEYIPADGNNLTEFLSNDVVVKSDTSLESVLSGLTLYHPVNDKKNFDAYLAVYKTLNVLPGYASYIESFGKMLMGAPAASYSGLLANFTDSGKVQRLLISLPLSEEQSQALAEAELLVLQQSTEIPDAYHLVSVSDNVYMDSKGTLQGEFVFRNLFITDSEGVIVPGSTPLSYTLDEAGKILLPVTLCGKDPETGEAYENKAYLVCEEEAKGIVNVVSVLGYDEITETYTARFQPDMNYVDRMIFSCTDRTLTRNEDNAVLDFEDWESVSVTDFGWDASDDYSLRFLENSLPENTLSIVFRLTDIQSNRYTSELFRLSEEEEDILYLIYDDKDQLITLGSPYCVLTNGFGMQLMFEVNNISDQEIHVALTGLKAEKIDTDAKAEIYGLGEHGGLMPSESQSMLAFIMEDQLGGIDSIEKMEFQLVVSSAASGEVLAVIPVTGSGHVTAE